MRFSNSGRGIAALAALAVLAGASGCGDSTGPMDRVAGAYEATTLMVTSDGRTFSVLDREEFAFLLNLRSNGTTAGYIYIPPEGDEDGGIDADLTGAWTLNGDRVTLWHSDDSLIRNFEYTVVGRTLVGGGVVDSEMSLSVVLTKK